MHTTLKIVSIAVLASVLVNIGFEYLFHKENSETRIADFYATENAVHVSPHSLRKKMDNGEHDFVLVDLRSAEEYETAHIIGAVNIPAYTDPNHSAYDEVERIVSAFEALPDDKEVIVYCYSTACMTGRKIGGMLAEHGLFVKYLGIGWNEWRYGFDMWNHDGETPVPASEYIHAGSEPGTSAVRELPSPCGEGDFSC